MSKILKEFSEKVVDQGIKSGSIKPLTKEELSSVGIEGSKANIKARTIMATLMVAFQTLIESKRNFSSPILSYGKRKDQLTGLVQQLVYQKISGISKYADEEITQDVLNTKEWFTFYASFGSQKIRSGSRTQDNAYGDVGLDWEFHLSANPQEIYKYFITQDGIASWYTKTINQMIEEKEYFLYKAVLTNWLDRITQSRTITYEVGDVYPAKILTYLQSLSASIRQPSKLYNANLSKILDSKTGIAPTEGLNQRTIWDNLVLVIDPNTNARLRNYLSGQVFNINMIEIEKNIAPNVEIYTEEDIDYQAPDFDEASRICFLIDKQSLFLNSSFAFSINFTFQSSEITFTNKETMRMDICGAHNAVEVILDFTTPIPPTFKEEEILSKDKK